MSKQINRQSGFTLVELAVVMIIIGLLIGGVLKGQELINNAQVASTISQVKGIDGATSTFRDMYAALPGDMLAPNNRLPNCLAAPCSTAGNGNGRLENIPSAAVAGEGLQFFVHLNAADLVTGINPANGLAWGGVLPAAPIRGSGFNVGSAIVEGNLASAVTAGARAGLYLTLTSAPGAAPAAAITPNQAARIDQKIDDGQPNTGVIRSNGGTCVNGAAYNESLAAQACFLHIRIQG